MALTDLLANTRNTAPPPVRLDDAILQSMTNLSRPPATQNVFDLLVDMIRNSITNTERAPAKNSPTGSNKAVGFGQFNGQKYEEAPAVTRLMPNTFMGESSVPRAPAPQSLPPPPIEGSIPSGAPGYPNFPLPVPPPNRPYYTTPFSVPNNSMPFNNQYYTTNINRGVAPPFTARGPSPGVSGVSSVNPNNNLYSVNNSRYPPPSQ